jgi:hypothetical protein
MISIELARRVGEHLAARGVPWRPESGDRFVLPGRDLDQVFVVSEMTIEVHELSTGMLIRFNGTTEWALDSIPAAEAVWLPREDQLRTLLGDRFGRLERLPGPPEGFAVVLTDGRRYADTDAECAYARALVGATASSGRG